MARLGLYPDAPKPPCVVGYEVAGTVAALGAGVDGGSRSGSAWWRRPGSAATPSGPSAQADGVVPLPEG